jgi:hypothetical protein
MKYLTEFFFFLLAKEDMYININNKSFYTITAPEVLVTEQDTHSEATYKQEFYRNHPKTTNM